MDIGPQEAIVWVQFGQAMVSFVVKSVQDVKAALAAGGVSDAEIDAKLDATHALNQVAIARERALVDGAK